MAGRRWLEKNFTYGDEWRWKPVEKVGEGREIVDPSTITTNKTFLKFIRTNGYRIVLDHDYEGLAETDWESKTITLNANCDHAVLSSLLQHELGHLMLFDADQFTTVRANTVRSIISSVIYTPGNIEKWGVQQLLEVENIVQDIIIETFSSSCVCSSFLSTYGRNAGVKHLRTMEDLKHITQEVCDNLLRDDGSMLDIPIPDTMLKALLESILKELQGDIDDINSEMKRVIDRHPNVESNMRRLSRDISRRYNQLDRVQKREEKRGSSPALDKLRQRLEDELDRLRSDAFKEQLQKNGEQRDERALSNLEKKLKYDEDLLSKIQDAAGQILTGDGSSGEGQGESDQDDGSNSEDSSNQQGYSDQQGQDDGKLHRNLTDHLPYQPPASKNGVRTHTCDAGFPMPVTIDRSDPDSEDHEQYLKQINPGRQKRKIIITDDDRNDTISTGHKIPDSEYTYFRSSKKEFSPADMLKGRRKLRATGINVLIGLDVSGSMTTEWGSKAGEIGMMIEDLKAKLDIDAIKFFTYDTEIHEIADKYTDLHPQAVGGNAFSYVYPKIMKKLPILQKNEIILVTDCGDNLGFPLNRTCEVERNGEQVQNHISVIDTESAGFYDMSMMDEHDWSLFSSDDPQLGDKIKHNLEKLIG
jgi:hypothetical protein